MPTSRRSRPRLRIAGFTSYSTALASAPPTELVEVEEALTPENAGQPAAIETVEIGTGGQARWSGIIGFENQSTGDGRIIDEGALRWPEDLEENPIPIRYVSSDVGAHDGAQVVGLIDGIERLTVEEANARLESLGKLPLDVPEGSVPIWGTGIFDDAPEAEVAQEAYRHVDKKLTTGVSMDLDDVKFEVEVSAENPEQETMRTKEARIRAATIVAIPAFAGARIAIDSGAGTDTMVVPDDAAGVQMSSGAELEDDNPAIIVSTNSARGMKAQAITKAKLRRLASRPGSTFAYQTTKIKSPEDGSWVETPAAAIDIAANSTAPDDPFEMGLSLLNEADMLELGSEEYLAKVREAVPFFEQAAEDGGDRGPDAKQVLEILENYLSIDWPAAKVDVEAKKAEAADQDASKSVDQAEKEQTTPQPEKTGEEQAPEGQSMASETDEFAFNPDQWRNPRNGQWVDMPSKIFGAFDGVLSGLTMNEKDRDRIHSAGGKMRELGGTASEQIGRKDFPGASETIGEMRDELPTLRDSFSDMPNTTRYDLEEALTDVNDKLASQETILFGLGEGSNVGSFDEPEPETADPFPESKIPQDWELSDDEGDPTILGPEELGDAGAVAFNEDEGGYYLPGVSEEYAGPFDTLDEAIAAAHSVGDGEEDDFVPPVGAITQDEIDQERIDAENEADARSADSVSDAKDRFDQLELEFDMDIPGEVNDFLEALDAGDQTAAEDSIDEMEQVVSDMLASDGSPGSGDWTDLEIEGMQEFLGEMKRQLEGWKRMNPDAGPKLAARWAEEFGVPDVQVEDILEAVGYREGTDEWAGLTATAQGFVKMVQAGVPTHDALAIYLRTLEETGRGALVFTSRSGQTFNWVEEVGGLPKYIREIADSLIKRGHSESRAIATAVETVKRWAKGGPARKGGKGHVSAKTVAKAAAALAEWEAKRVRARASSATTQSMTASVAKPKLTMPEIVSMRREKLAQLRSVELGSQVVEEAEAIVAGARGNAVSQRPVVALKSAAGVPVAPPKAWFENPNLKEATPITVDDNGRIYGHLASWNVCHAGSPAGEGVCIMAPKSQTGYAYFHTGAVKTAEGHTLATGRLCMNGQHADTKLNAIQASAHYDNTTLAVADVRVGEDRFGIWVAGAMRPDTTPNQLRAFRASPLSGDWRRIAGHLELTVGLSVNAPGFAIPRVNGLVASVGGDSEAADHELISLVAAGMIPPRKVIPPTEEGAFSVEELKYLRSLAAREKAQIELAAKEAVLEKASKLAAGRNRAKVAAFAAKRMESKSAQEAEQKGSEN